MERFMNWFIMAGLTLALSGCGQDSSDPEVAEKGAFEAYTDRQVEALDKAKGVEDELKKADEARRKQLEQMQ